MTLVTPLGCKVILESPFHGYRVVGCILLLGQPQGSICKSSSEDVRAAHAEAWAALVSIALTVRLEALQKESSLGLESSVLVLRIREV